MFSKQYLSNELGLSCVEDYIMYLMNSQGIKWKIALYGSFIDFKEIAYQMNVRRCEYSDINFIRRIQNVLKDEMVIKLEHISFLNVEFLEKKSYFMIQVKPHVMKDRYNTVTLRSDHYWLIYKQDDNTYEYMNDRPYASEKIDFLGLKEVIDSDDMVLIRILDDKLIAKTTEKFDIFVKSLDLVDMQKFDLRTLDVEKLRDSIGIYRITIRRVEAFLQACGKCIDLSEYYSVMDKIYIKLEYMRIRKKINSDALIVYYDQMAEMQSNIIKKIKIKFEREN